MYTFIFIYLLVINALDELSIANIRYNYIYYTVYYTKLSY